MRFASLGLTCLIACAGFAIGSENPQASGGTSGTVRGLVADPSGAAIPGATVTMQNRVSHYNQTASSDSQGKFQFVNVPFNNYHVSVSASGFAAGEQDVNVRSPIPIEANVTLQLGTASTSVVVTAEAADLVETNPVTHTDVDRGLFEKLPTESQSSSLSSLVTQATPGVAADSNGMFHGLGDHASNSFSVDGQPITDQQSKVFSNQIPTESVQSMEVIEGAPPAEYGDKTSLVVVVTTRSGLGATTPHGSVTAGYGSFGTSNAGFDVSFGSNNVGNFLAVSGMNTGRFLDGPEFGVLHDRGNKEDVFDRLDFKPSQNDTVNINLGFTRSWFQTPNSYDAQSATAWSGLVVDNGGIGPNGQVVGPTDQRAQIRTFNIAPNWTRAIGGDKVWNLLGWVRQDQFNYYPSNDPFSDLLPNLQLQTVGQNRKLTSAGAEPTFTYSKGIHNLKAGVMYEHTFLTERDTLGIVDPTFNPVCMNADGSPYTGASITSPAACKGQLSPNPAFVPLLGCYDLTRTATLPASDGCTSPTSGPYRFYGHADIKELALFLQDSITVKNWNFNVGVRADFYNGLASANQLEPRMGIAYNFKPTGTVLRVSYARTLETPFNENLVLSSQGCSDPVIYDIMSRVGPCVSAPLGPGWRNEFHAGFQQAFGRFLTIDAEYIWKYTHRAFDFSVLGNTPITFPIEWNNSKIPGYTVRASMPELHGFSAYVVMSSVAARFFTPQVAGIGATPSGSDVFRIDHDEKFNQNTHLQYQFGKAGPWIGFSWRYDSGMVAGAVPCAGGNCNNGPNGTDTTVDVSNLTPDQQYQAGLFCGNVFATPTRPISATGLCPASQYGSTLLSIPAPGAENDDHNPPRIASRNLFDIAVGHDNIFHGDKYKWSFRVSVVNLTNKVALYNFLSTFSGTHFVTPRAISAAVTFHF
jgi:Carboxypeptidase regulatory-like domain/TonB-dependent Receptor Plug Domain